VNSVSAVYIPTDSWIDGTSGSADLVSGSPVHPSQQGYFKIFQQQYKLLSSFFYGCGAGAAMQPMCNGVW
jgi:hypothetical protein